MLAHIWNEKGILPSVIYNLPAGEREFIYQATRLKVKAEERAARKKGGRK